MFSALLAVAATCSVTRAHILGPTVSAWQEPTIEPSEFVVTADGEVAVTVTLEPETSESDLGPGLPDTGALGTGTAIAGVIALIGVGVIALFRIGRRSTTA